MVRARVIRIAIEDLANGINAGGLVEIWPESFRDVLNRVNSKSVDGEGPDKRLYPGLKGTVHEGIFCIDVDKLNDPDSG